MRDKPSPNRNISSSPFYLFDKVSKRVLVHFMLVYLKETRNSSKIRPLDFEKKMKAQLRKMFCKVLMNTRVTISVMLLC